MVRKKNTAKKNLTANIAEKKIKETTAPVARGFFKSPEFKCRKARNEEKYYCYQRVQGRWEECQGPFDSLDECLACTG